MLATSLRGHKMNDSFYRAFEERYYAPREFIKTLRRQYLPFVTPLVAKYPHAPTFDIGCGRGEWLELMNEIGFKPYGVDLDQGMLNDCVELNLPMEKGDAVAFLKNLPSESQAVVTAFHVVEHISFEQLRLVVSESLRVLKPGGLLIMETPNPENIVVATRNFYIDPTHVKPIPQQLLSFLPEFYGFARVKTIRLQESKELRQSLELTLKDVFEGVSPDYAVIAQKIADQDLYHSLNTPFEGEYGLSFDDLANNYDLQIKSLVEKAQAQAEKAQAQAEKAQAQAEKAQAQAEKAQAQAEKAQAQAEQIFRIFNLVLSHLKLFIKQRPWLYRLITNMLRSLSGLHKRLSQLIKLIPSLFLSRSKENLLDDDFICKPNFSSTDPGIIKPKQLLLDVSVIVHGDAKSGIQRVVRSLLRDFIDNPPMNIDVRPIYFDGFRYKYANRFIATFTGKLDIDIPDENVYFCQDDTYLALDLNAHLTNSVHNLHMRLQLSGVRLYFIIYDILLIQHPEWWPEGTSSIFNAWMHSISKAATGLICISEAVAEDVRSWLNVNRPERLSNIVVSSFHLGADLESSLPTKGLPETAEPFLSSFISTRTFLMVGTLEPRKGHMQTLEAFELLWQKGLDIKLVIVGKRGWLVESLIGRINNHKELNKRLFWFEGISDEYLERIYAASTCLIAASEGEGFGLPLIEAAINKKPIIVRNIPVFREVAGNHASYFDGLKPGCLAQAISDWLELFEKGEHPSSEGMPILTWHQSAVNLRKLIELDQLD
jgi:glycosyltransferase involved in cell wall biosynthesis/SAM-dependent methyltransferase